MTREADARPVGPEIRGSTVVREGETEPFDVSLVRITIQLTAVRARPRQRCCPCVSRRSMNRPTPKLKEGLERAQVKAAGGIENASAALWSSLAQQPPVGLLKQAIRPCQMPFLEEGRDRSAHVAVCGKWRTAPMRRR